MGERHMMEQLTNNMLLYHGSYCAVHMPDLKQCAKHKDFGHRKARTFMNEVEKLKGKDIIGGKIANDNTNATITTYMAVEKTITEQTKKNAIDLLVTMVVDELAEELNLSPTKLLPQFVTSQTGKLLYDEESKLWWSGPSDIAEMYKAEIANRNDES